MTGCNFYFYLTYSIWSTFLKNGIFSIRHWISARLYSVRCPKSNPNVRVITWNVVKNMILHELFCVVSRLPRYISCYIAENRFPLGQCTRIFFILYCTNISTKSKPYSKIFQHMIMKGPAGLETRKISGSKSHDSVPLNMQSLMLVFKYNLC